MKNRSDFEPDQTPVRSIKEIIEQEISYTSYDGKTDNPLQVESMEQLLQRIYAHIEKKALERFKSNQLWAIKSWTYENILNEAVKEALAEDAEDFAAFDERADEPLISYDEMVKRLKKDGRL